MPVILAVDDSPSMRKVVGGVIDGHLWVVGDAM